MSSIISSTIGPQRFEYIQDRIGRILTAEIEAQYLRTYDVSLDIRGRVYKERFIPFNPPEVPAVNVMLWKGDSIAEDQSASQWNWRFIIECIMSAPHKESGSTVDDKRGDTLSMTRLKKLMGVIRAILMNPKYKTLNFTPPFIGHRHIESMAFMKHPHQDADHSSIGRLILVVQAPEGNELIDPNLIKGYDTRVKLYSTDMGYLWSLDEPAHGTFDESFASEFD